MNKLSNDREERGKKKGERRRGGRKVRDRSCGVIIFRRDESGGSS